MRKVLLLASLALAMLLICGVAFAETAPVGTLDANTLPSDSRSGYNGPNPSVKRAQTFTALSSGKVTSAQARVFGENNLIMEVVRVDPSGRPTDDVLASTTIPGSGYIYPGLVTGNFDSPASVVAGQKYALVLRTTDGSWGWTSRGSLGENYPGGENYAYDYSSPWNGWQLGSYGDAIFAIYVDGTPPSTTIESGPNGPTNDDTPTFTFTGSDDGTSAEKLKYFHKVDGGSWSTPSADTSVTLTSLSEGNHTFSVKAVDEAGNEDADPASRSFAVDKTVPNVTLVSPLENATKVSRSTTVTATFSEEKININTLVSRTDVTPNDSTLKLEKVIASKRGTAPTYKQVDVGVGYDETTKKVTLYPSATLDRNTTYRMTITTGVQDLAGNALAQDKAWTFKTASR